MISNQHGENEQPSPLGPPLRPCLPPLVLLISPSPFRPHGASHILFLDCSECWTLVPSLYKQM